MHVPLAADTMMKTTVTAACASLLVGLASAQCSETISAAGYPAPSMADGWQAHVIANEFTKPRSIKRVPVPEGATSNTQTLLIVDQDDESDAGGIWKIVLEGEAPCLTVSDRQQLIQNGSLNHGLELSPDGSILYASSQEAVYAWDFDPETAATTSEARRVVNLGGDGSHSTRTLLLPPNDPDYLLVSWGSDGNIDPQARDPSTGYSTVKAFNISDTSQVYEYTSDGILIGWGLRNSVGLGQNPVTGGIFSNENNVDNLERDGVSIVEDNPAEELNFHGYLNGTESPNLGAYYGYPECFPAWDAEAVPNNDGRLATGVQFAASNVNDSVTDDWCLENAINPVLSFTAHMAPMDLEFNTQATVAYISFRGSWNREDPAGYKLSMIPFNNETGLPSASPDSMNGYVDIMSNQDPATCPDGTCFRPVGLEWSQGGEQLFMASDATGEIYIVYRDDGSVNDFTAAATATEEGSGSGGETPTESGAATESSEAAASGLSVAQSWSLGFLGLVAAYLL